MPLDIHDPSSLCGMANHQQKGANNFTAYICISRLKGVFQNGEFMREQQPLLKKLKILFLFNPLVEWSMDNFTTMVSVCSLTIYVVDETARVRQLFRYKTTQSKKKEEASKSKDEIPGFIDTYHIDMNLFEPSDWREYSVREYRSF
jgi:hypothetical protein